MSIKISKSKFVAGVEDGPDFVLECRDEISWALVPLEMKKESSGKGWNRTNPQKPIEVLWVAGVIE